jgi:hypothetical protein
MTATESAPDAVRPLAGFRWGLAESGYIEGQTTLPQIEVARVKPVDRLPPDLRLSDKPIDLMKDFRLSNAERVVA